MKHPSFIMQTILAVFLCAFAWSCKSAKTAETTNTESGRNTVVQAQWRSAQSLSVCSLKRLTALSFDSCALYFPPTRYTGEHGDTSPPLPDVSSLKGKAPDKNSKAHNNNGKAHNKNSNAHKNNGNAQSNNANVLAPTRASPSIIKLYGLHLSQEVKEESAAAQAEADSLAKAMQSSYDKSQSSTTESSPFLSKTTKLKLIIFLIIAATILSYIIRRKQRNQ